MNAFQCLSVRYTIEEKEYISDKGNKLTLWCSEDQVPARHTIEALQKAVGWRSLELTGVAQQNPIVMDRGINSH